MIQIITLLSMKNEDNISLISFLSALHRALHIVGPDEMFIELKSRTCAPHTVPAQSPAQSKYSGNADG